MFDIRNYMWEIFELSQSGEVHNVRLALDLFLVNVELGESRYEGASMDYASIMLLWNKLSDQEKELQKDEFNLILDINYKCLCDYWVMNNRERFDRFVYDGLHNEELDQIQETLHRLALARQKRKRHRSKSRKRKNKNVPKIKKF